MSKIFKSSRIVLDDKAFVLSTKANEIHVNDEIEEMAVSEGLSPSDTANQLIETAKREADKILEEADRDYEQKMINAQNSSDSIISTAYDQAKEIMEQAKAEGYQDGYNKALVDSQNEAGRIIEESITIKKQLLQSKESLMQDAEAEMIQLVIEAIEKVLEYKIETDQTLIESLIKQGISRVNKSHQVSIRVSNDDYNHAIAIRPMILATSEKIEDIEIKRDPSLQNGACIIDTDSGSVDSSINIQLDQIKKIFDELLKGD